MHHDDGPYLTARLALLPGARYYVTHFDSASGLLCSEFGQSCGKPDGGSVDAPEDGETRRCDVLQRRVFSAVELSLAALLSRGAVSCRRSPGT
jgi:hypothetical protein